jgi:carbon-monoxide dehydrogenase medium subunit
MLAFDYERPADLPAALALLRGDPEARPLAGGQTLLPVLRARLAAPSRLVDLGRLAGLSGIALADGRLRIGAGETHAAVATDPLVVAQLPALAALAGGIGDPQVRNRGTIGGSLANNDPAACYPAAALALGATIETSRRAVAAADFFTGLFATALEPGEIVTAVSFPTPARASYLKHPNPASRFALIGVFHARFADGHRLAITGGGTGVFRWTEGEAHLDSGGGSAALTRVPLALDRFTGDLHGSAGYRLHVARVVAARAAQAPGSPA